MNMMMRSAMTTLFGAWLLSVPAYAQFLPPASNDIKLQVTRQEIDEDAAGRPEKPHAEAIGKQLKVDPLIVEDLRANKQGWGEIAIRLILALEMRKKTPHDYPDITQAIRKIGDLRKQRQSWGEIAKQLDIDLAPVVEEAQRARQELRVKPKPKGTG